MGGRVSALGASTVERNAQNKLAGELAASRRIARAIAGLGGAAADDDDDSIEVTALRQFTECVSLTVCVCAGPHCDATRGGTEARGRVF